MAIVNRFEDLIYWQKARLLSGEIHQLTSDDIFQDDIDLKHQMRRSAASVMDNIATGFSRGPIDEFTQFVGIARGSLAELKSQLYRSLDNEYISKPVFDDIYSKANQMGKLLDGFYQLLNNRPDNPGRAYSQETSDD